MEFNVVEYKRILLETFRAFLAFCDRNEIRYVAAYGTVLGAVRHKGLIPWDDDIDVVMLREDYEKFLRLKNSPDLHGYKIFDYNDKGYPLSYAKFCDGNSTIWERKHVPFTFGVFIDVFPLDPMPNDQQFANKIATRSRQLMGRYIESIRTYSWCDFRDKMWLVSMIKHLIFSPQKCLSELSKIQSELSKKYKDSDFVMFLETEILYPVKYFKNTVEVEFEGMKIQIPEDYDGYLTMRYGDYMTLPPVEQRCSTHGHYFVDLKNGLSVEEIKKQ